MTKKLIVFFCMCCAIECSAQYTFYKGNGYLELSGYITTYYNYRFYPSGTTDFKKNRFVLDYGVLKLDGTVNKIWNYQLQLNSTALFDPQSNDGFMMQATASYNALKDNLSISIGYDKVPFCRASLVANTESPFLQRPEVARGEVFNRRDIGVKASYSLWNKKINLYAGAYTGMGALSLQGDNDESGNLEYVGRAEFSWPARYRYHEVDFNHINIPVISFGVDGRYAKKKTATGIDYSILTVDGEKISYSGDISAAWKGFSAQVGAVRVQITPNDSLALFSKPTSYYMTGGFIAQLNYYFIKYKSVLAVRYDEYNQNDLITGDREGTISIAYNYLFDGLRSCIKVHYMKRLEDPDATEIWNDDQLRIGLQLLF